MTIARRLTILLAVPLLILLGLGVLTRFQLAEIEKRTAFAAVNQVRSHAFAEAQAQLEKALKNLPAA